MLFAVFKQSLSPRLLSMFIKTYIRPTSIEQLLGMYIHIYTRYKTFVYVNHENNIEILEATGIDNRDV